MAAEATIELTARRLGIRIAPLVAIALAALGARTALAAAHPLPALLLFLWIAADTMMLALLARSPAPPPGHAVLAVLAGACTAVAIGIPPPLREALQTRPGLMAAMALPVAAHVAWGVSRAQRVLATGAGPAEQRWMMAFSELLPPAWIRLAAAELALLHLALFRWGGPADVPAGCRAFSYHRHLAPMCATLLVLSAIEMAVYHLLLGHWSRTAALVLFVVSDLGFLYLVGLIKSFRLHPVLLTPEGVRIRAGLLIDRLVPYDTIVAVETGFTGEDVRAPATLNAALLAWPNLLLRLNQPLPRRSLFVRKPPFRSVTFRLDDPEPFVRMLRWRLGGKSG